MNIPYADLKAEFTRVLHKLSFSEYKAALCAGIFADNSLDGVYSHGVNRFPVFVKYVREGLVQAHAEPVVAEQSRAIEKWDGQYGPGMYNATLAMNRAVALAKENGIGCVALKNTNHWMRGGTYGWQAANSGCIGICFSNTIANMPAWGGKEPRLGNNPLIIAVPRQGGHIVLDMAMSQYSYGKLQENSLRGSALKVPGGYDITGALTDDPDAIMASKRALPIGFWKGSGLSFVLDVLLTAITGGNSTARITASGGEAGLSQVFICLHRPEYEQALVDEIIAYSKSGEPVTAGEPVLYPGENTLATRRRNEAAGIPVDDSIWKSIREM